MRSIFIDQQVPEATVEFDEARARSGLVYWKEFLSELNLQSALGLLDALEARFLSELINLHNHFNAFVHQFGFNNNLNELFVEDFDQMLNTIIGEAPWDQHYRALTQQAIKIKEKIIKAICQVYVHREAFFVAPYEDQQGFNQFFSQYPELKQLFSPINTHFMRYLVEESDRNDYWYATTGKSDPSRASVFRLSANQTQHLEIFLWNHPLLTFVLSKNLMLLDRLGDCYQHFSQKELFLSKFQKDLLEDEYIFNFITKIFGEWGRNYSHRSY